MWELRVSLGADPITGKYQYVSRTVRGGKRQAQSALAQLVTEAESPRLSARHKLSTVTLADLVAMHLEHHPGSPTTLRGYRSILEFHIRPTIGRLKLADVDARILDQFYEYLGREHALSPSRVHQVHAVIRGALALALRWGWCTANPARDARPPTVRRAELTLPTVEQVQQALDEAVRHSLDFGLFVRLAASTGARRGELCALRWRDTDLRAATARIETSAYETVAGGVDLKSTKNHSKRVVSLDTETVAMLERHWRDMIERGLAAGCGLGADAFVFSDATDAGRPWAPDRVTHMWSRLRERVGLPGVRLHDLRHFQATMLLKAGVPVKNVSARIGHRDAATTLNVYAHFLEDDDRESASLIGDLLDSPRTKGTRPNGGPTRRRGGSDGPPA